MLASETVDFEREFEELVRELRALPTDAPATVRERVRALGEPEPRRVFRQLTWRRAVVVLVPACVVAVVAAAAISGIVSSSNRTKHVAAEAVKQQPNANPRRQVGITGHTASGGAVYGTATAQQDVLGPT